MFSIFDRPSRRDDYDWSYFYKIFAITLAVLVGSVVLTTLIWWNSCRGRRRVNRTVTKESFKGNLRPTNFCGCIELGWRSIVETIFCPVCLFAETVERSLPRAQQKGLFNQIMVMMSDCGCYIVAKNVSLRRRYAELGLPEAREPEDDLCALVKVTECGPCTIMQLAEFTELYAATFGKWPAHAHALLEGGGDEGTGRAPGGKGEEAWWSGYGEWEGSDQWYYDWDESSGKAKAGQTADEETALLHGKV